MRLLLDTHAFLWAAGNPAALSLRARAAIEDTANDVFLSAAAAWEIAIKYSLGKLSLPLEPATYVPARIESLGFRSLPITAQHALAVSALPRHHADPFDRMMIAQAQMEGLTFVTADRFAPLYAVSTLDASS